MIDRIYENQHALEAERTVRSVTVLGPEIKGIGSGIIEAMERIGITVNRCDNLDRASGPQDRILILVSGKSIKETLASVKKHNYLPPVRVWYTEQVPNPTLPATVAARASQIRLIIDSSVNGHDLPGWRFRMVGEMLRLGTLTSDLVIHTFSDTNTLFFRRLGLTAQTTPLGADEFFGQRSNIPFEERSVQVLFLGSTGDKRRGPIINQLCDDLSKRGIRLEVRSEKNPIFSTERTSLLGDTKIMLAIARQPYDDHQFRLMLGGVNGVLVMAENTIQTSKGKFIPGQDYVESSIQEMPDTIEYFLKNPEQSALIARSLNNKIDQTRLSTQILQVLL